jgi:hypothetical protein
MNLFRWSPRTARYPSLGEVPPHPVPWAGAQLRTCIAFPWEVDMHDTKERLSVLWIFALLNYLYADVVALFDIVGSRNPFEPLPQWARWVHRS